MQHVQIEKKNKLFLYLNNAQNAKQKQPQKILSTYFFTFHSVSGHLFIVLDLYRPIICIREMSMFSNNAQMGSIALRELYSWA